MRPLLIGYLLGLLLYGAKTTFFILAAEEVVLQTMAFHMPARQRIMVSAKKLPAGEVSVWISSALSWNFYRGQIRLFIGGVHFGTWHSEGAWAYQPLFRVPDSWPFLRGVEFGRTNRGGFERYGDCPLLANICIPEMGAPLEIETDLSESNEREHLQKIRAEWDGNTVLEIAVLGKHWRGLKFFEVLSPVEIVQAAPNPVVT